MRLLTSELLGEDHAEERRNICSQLPALSPDVTLNAGPPAVSVIIPARNERHFVGAALGSVLHQQYPLARLECVVVDNASHDGTSDVVREFAASHPDLSCVLVSEPTPGVGAAKNAGASVARGTVLIFLDADSRMAPDLTNVVAREYACGRLVASIRVVADGGGAIDRAFFRLMEFGKVRFGIRAQMLYCDREIFQRLAGFDVKLRLGEDVEFLKRARLLLQRAGLPGISHVAASEIATSPRRLAANHRLGTLTVFARWLLAFLRIGRGRPY